MIKTTKKNQGTPFISSRLFLKIGCGIIFLVWLIPTIVLTFFGGSLLPAMAGIFAAEGTWVSVAITTNWVVAFAIAGSLVFSWMFIFSGAAFVAVGTWSFFKHRVQTQNSTPPTEPVTETPTDDQST